MVIILDLNTGICDKSPSAMLILWFEEKRTLRKSIFGERYRGVPRRDGM